MVEAEERQQIPASGWGSEEQGSIVRNGLLGDIDSSTDARAVCNGTNSHYYRIKEERGAH